MSKEVFISSSHFDDRYRSYCGCSEMSIGQSFLCRQSVFSFSFLRFFSLFWRYCHYTTITPVVDSFYLPSLTSAVLFQSEVWCLSTKDCRKPLFFVLWPLDMQHFHISWHRMGLNMSLYKKKRKNNEKLKSNQCCYPIHTRDSDGEKVILEQN